MNIKRANEIIIKALENSIKPSIAFSGGKDSLVVLDLVRKVDPNVPALFNNTGVEHPETIAFCKTIKNLSETKPEITFWECIEKYGWPQSKAHAPRHGNMCCFLLKEKPADIYYKEHQVDLVFTGLTMAESELRFLTLSRLGPYYYAKTQGRWKCHPIYDWTEKDVWDYIKKNNLVYNDIYKKGAKRCGCAPCTAYKDWRRNLANDNPKLLRIVLKKQGQKQLEDCITGS